MGNFWFQDKYDNKVYETTQYGTIISSFCPPGIDSHFLPHDGLNLWKIEKPEENKNIIVVKILDLINNCLTLIISFKN